MIGPGCPIDTDRYFVVCPNVLGGCQGTTGPSSLTEDGSPYGLRFPIITIRDQVAVEARLSEELGIDSWALVVGGSMGGMRALEWCVTYPDKVERAFVLAAPAATSATQIALGSLQIRAIELDPNFRGGDYYGDRPPVEGLAVARGLGHLSYRGEEEINERFGRRPQGDLPPLLGGEYQVESYLRYHGDKLVTRFDANSYIRLSQAMHLHDVGRGRGGIEAALSRVTARVFVAGVTTDKLFPLEEQFELSRYLPCKPKTQIIDSRDGHDGFLTESIQVGELIASSLES